MYLIDTMVLSELRRRQRDPGVVAWITRQQHDHLFLSVVSIGEIERGIARQRRTDPPLAEELATWLQRLLHLHRYRPGARPHRGDPEPAPLHPWTDHWPSSSSADLPDRNVWPALSWPDHSHHQQAFHYWEQQAADQLQRGGELPARLCTDVHLAALAEADGVIAQAPLAGGAQRLRQEAQDLPDDFQHLLQLVDVEAT